MAKTSKETSKRKGFENLKDPEQYLVAGPGGATHQTAKGDQGSLTTNQGVVVADNQNTLKSGRAGPLAPGRFRLPGEDHSFRS